ncbi:MAG: hypothetical protein IPQ19_04080 [Bacteroidetes bacterium]|nr:hypothetical protein [Bacteroidota bacterium]
MVANEIRLKNALALLIFPIFCYLALIVKWGYEFGRGDQIEILPYSLILNGNSNFQNDFFYQSILKILPNERWFISKLISLFGQNTQLFVFIIHFLSTIFLIIGMEKLGNLLINNKLATRITIFLTLVLFNYYYNLGGNELYYNNLQGSSIAKSLGIWSIYFLFVEKLNKTAICLFIATLFHPIVGFQLNVLLLGILLFFYFKNKNSYSFKIPFLTIVLSFAFLISIQLAYKKANMGFPNTNFSQIIFHFRNGHHYIPSQFQLNGWILLSFSFLFSFIYFWQKTEVKLWIFLSILFILLYLVGLGFEILPIISMQAFKLTIWIKYLGILSFFGLAIKYFPILKKYAEIKHQYFIYFFGSIFGLLFLIFAPSTFFPDNVKYDFGNQTNNDDAIKISLHAKKITTKDAIFIVPSNFTEIAFYGQRSCYISDKANPKYPKAAKEWASRIFTIYGLDYRVKDPKWWLANTKYEQQLQDSLIDYKKLGITHIICTSTLRNNVKFEKKAGKYKLYSLRK